MVTLLTCPWCGAPLPHLTAGQALVRCLYCGSTASLTGVAATKVEQHQGAPAMALTDPELNEHTTEAFLAAHRDGASMVDALALAAGQHLGSLGQTETFARVCLALMRDFDAEHGTRASEDTQCVSRMIGNYLRAIEEIRTTGSFDLNLPFFAVTAQGPCHLRRTLTAKTIAELAAQQPEAAEQPKAAAPPKPKKRGFWPFG